MELNVLTRKYLDANGIHYRYFSECIGVEYTTCLKWFSGKRKMNAEKLRKVHDFLNGKYAKSIEQVIQESQESIWNVR